MRKFKILVISFLFILIGGLMLQRYSAYFYSSPVGRIEKVDIVEEQQELTIRLLNDSQKMIVVKTDYYPNEVITPTYDRKDQVLLGHSGNTWEITSLKRDGYVFILVASFLLLVLVIAGKKGLFSLVGVFINLAFLLFLLWLNQQNRSINLLLLMSIYTVFAVILSMGSLHGLRKIDLRKVLATLISVFVAYFITISVMFLLKDNGLRYEEMQLLTRPYRLVFLASLMIGGIGAALDNVVIIVSSLDEIMHHTPGMATKDLLRSGMNIASDTSASMMNVLLYAYLSSATPVFVFYLANGWNFFETFKMHLSLEILRALCGGIAILLTIPSSLLLFILFRKNSTREGENR